jgi:phage host-nuclease inhibitor protein Gam
MAAKRTKSTAVAAVQSREEAIEKLRRFADLTGQIEARAERVKAAIAQMKAEADKLDAPLVAEMLAIHAAIQPWWAVAGATVTTGDRKTAELGGCVLGHRIGNPTLKYPTPEPVAIRLLLEQGWKGLLRIKTELDKPAIVAALRWLDAPVRAGEANDENIDVEYARRWFAATGFRVAQKEEFFIDRLGNVASGSIEASADPVREAAE